MLHFLKSLSSLLVTSLLSILINDGVVRVILQRKILSAKIFPVLNYVFYKGQINVSAIAKVSSALLRCSQSGLDSFQTVKPLFCIAPPL